MEHSLPAGTSTVQKKVRKKPGNSAHMTTVGQEEEAWKGPLKGPSETVKYMVAAVCEAGDAALALQVNKHCRFLFAFVLLCIENSVLL